MPLYEFKCRACGRRFETLVFSSSQAIPLCPTCDSHDVEKLYSSFGVGGSGGGRADSAPVRFGGG
jgi:putative FmdB family regulatory protein